MKCIFKNQWICTQIADFSGLFPITSYNFLFMSNNKETVTVILSHSNEKILYILYKYSISFLQLVQKY